jgi:membrane protease YdiL (CAAX protease family)
LVFGMQHLRSGPSAFAHSTGFGIEFSLLFLATGNLWAVMIAHATGNLLTVWRWAPKIEKARQSALQRVPIFLG